MRQHGLNESWAASITSTAELFLQTFCTFPREFSSISRQEP